MRTVLILFLLLSPVLLTSQENCNLKLSKNNGIIAVDTNDIRCIAQNAAQKNTLFFTFGIWCEPCRLHLPGAIKFAKTHNLNFYVLLVEPEDDAKTSQAIDYLRKLDPGINIAVLKDSYGLKRSRKNKNFVKEITPQNLEAIDDYSKYILLDKSGKVLMVTNWKDNRDNDWRDDTAMVKRKLLPLL